MKVASITVEEVRGFLVLALVLRNGRKLLLRQTEGLLTWGHSIRHHGNKCKILMKEVV